MQLLIASKNVHKIREIRSVLKSLKQLDLVSLLDFPTYTPPEESGETFEENARIKAEDAAKVLGRWALADDSGLIVPALGGLPGVRSARYAGDKASDNDNVQKLHQAMASFKNEERNAYFQCNLVLAAPDGTTYKSVKAVCEGTIIDEARGSSGFGFSPLFIKHEYSKTFAELDDDTRIKISHRGKALSQILLVLEALQLQLQQQK